MRTIKFRGKRIDNGEWIYGGIIFWSNGNYEIHNSLGHFHRVDPKTVGQFTGLKDKNGVEIWESDLLYSEFSDKTFEVTFYEGAWVLTNETTGEDGWRLDSGTAEQALIIGNVYQNPELL